MSDAREARLARLAERRAAWAPTEVVQVAVSDVLVGDWLLRVEKDGMRPLAYGRDGARVLAVDERPDFAAAEDRVHLEVRGYAAYLFPTDVRATVRRVKEQ